MILEGLLDIVALLALEVYTVMLNDLATAWEFTD